VVHKPDKALGLGLGLVILMTILVIDLILALGMLAQQPGMTLFFHLALLVLSVPLLALWTFWYAGLVTLRYSLDRNALRIRSGVVKHVIPLDAVLGIRQGTEVEVSERFRGVGWPGYLNGVMHLAQLGPLWALSTEPLDRQLIVVTSVGCYGISPREPKAFQRECIALRRLGSIRAVKQRAEPASIARLGLWRDRLFWATLGLAVSGNVALLGYVMARYDSLPTRVPLRFGAAGQPLHVVGRAWVLIMPLIGALAWATNAMLGAILHRWERLSAHLLSTMAAAVQGALWLAAVRVIGR
jgi:hypothetical protein